MSSVNKVTKTNSIKPDPKFKVGEVVIVNTSLGPKKRHIYAKPSWTETNGMSGYIYPVDYGLGCTSEGVALELNMRSQSKEDHSLVL